MRFIFALIACLFTGHSYADAGVNLLVGKESSSKSLLVKRKASLTLDDPFLIQFYAKFKSLNSNNSHFNDQVSLVFEGDLSKYLKNEDGDYSSKEERNLFYAGKLYSLWKLELYHTFFAQWLKGIKKNKIHLNSDLMLALDQVVTIPMSEWFVANAIYLSPSDKKFVLSFDSSSVFHKFVKAWASLRTGDKGLEFIGELKRDSSLSYLLAQSAVVDFAKKGKLSEAGKILKEVVGPYLEKTQDVEKISSYYITLGRLLFQAGAYKQALDYYRKVPEASPYYLKSKVESLWVLLVNEDYSRLQGEIKSFDLALFEDEFLPEAYLVSAISNLKLCKFEETHDAFKSYVRANKKQALILEKNLKAVGVDSISKYDFYLKNIDQGISLMTTELSKLGPFKVSLKDSLLKIKSNIEELKVQRASELKRKWANRKKILNKSIFEMRFVKIEFLSKMRNLQNEIVNRKKNRDVVKTYRAQRARGGELEFPYDGIPFGDEIFNLRGDIQDLCKEELKRGARK